MSGAKIHGALLATAFLLAILTWNWEAPSEIELERVLVWQKDTSAVISVSYQSSGLDLALKRYSEDEAEVVFWAGFEINRQGRLGTSALDTLVFPLGQPGAKLIEDLAEFRVLRDLGDLARDRAVDFGLNAPAGTVSIEFSDGVERLEIGKTPVGSNDRYAWDSPEGTLYVIPADVIRPLILGSEALRERQVHYFLPEDITRVRIEVDDHERTMVRESSDIGGPAIWYPSGSPADSDITFTNFMERVAQISIEGFGKTAPRDSLVELMRIQYFGLEDEELGFLRFYTDSDQTSESYFVLSERTKVLAEAMALQAEIVAFDLTNIF